MNRAFESKKYSKEEISYNTMFAVSKSSWEKLVIPTDAGREKFPENFSKLQSCSGHTYSEFLEKVELESSKTI